MFCDFISLIDMSKIQLTIPTRAKNSKIPNCLKYLKMEASKKPINKNNPMITSY